MAICTNSKNGVCVVCGSRVYPRVIQKCKKREKSLNLTLEQIDIPDDNLVNRPKVFKLGDWTEKKLKQVGVSPERYTEAKTLFGFAPTCGCGKRKEWLNKVSDWWQNIDQNGV